MPSMTLAAERGAESVLTGDAVTVAGSNCLI